MMLVPGGRPALSYLHMHLVASMEDAQQAGAAVWYTDKQHGSCSTCVGQM